MLFTSFGSTGGPPDPRDYTKLKMMKNVPKKFVKSPLTSDSFQALRHFLHALRQTQLTVSQQFLHDQFGVFSVKLLGDEHILRISGQEQNLINMTSILRVTNSFLRGRNESDEMMLNENGEGLLHLKQRVAKCRLVII